MTINNLKYQRLTPTPGAIHFEILDNPDKLTTEEIVSIVDNNNHNYGYEHYGDRVTIFID